MPGSASYRKRHIEEGLLGDFVDVGFNQAALVVLKGNPRNISADVKQMLRKDLAIVICNHEKTMGKQL